LLISSPLIRYYYLLIYLVISDNSERHLTFFANALD
jgi:hypothetical protein